MNNSKLAPLSFYGGNFNVVDKDIADFDALAAKGVKLFAQMVPGDSPKDFMPLLDKVR